MKKTQIARLLAKQSRISEAEAADQIDRVIHQIVSRLRKGEPAPLPGLGRFSPGEKWSFQFDKFGKKGAHDK